MQECCIDQSIEVIRMKTVDEYRCYRAFISFFFLINDINCAPLTEDSRKSFLIWSFRDFQRRY